jgi:hypothetical protein
VVRGTGLAWRRVPVSPLFPAVARSPFRPGLSFARINVDSFSRGLVWAGRAFGRESPHFSALRYLLKDENLLARFEGPFVVFVDHFKDSVSGRVYVHERRQQLLLVGRFTGSD